MIIKGSVPEWLMGVDCKSTGLAYVGSNPTRPNKKNKRLINILKEILHYLADNFLSILL